MCKKILTAVFFLFCITNIYADEQNNLEQEKSTSLLLISSKGDHVGHGSFYIYKKESGTFSFQMDKEKNKLDFHFNDFNKVDAASKEYWDISFGAQQNRSLQIGKYLHCRRFAGVNNPMLDIGSCNRGYNQGLGKFEILDLTFNKSGKVDSFAANALIRSNVGSSPLFASIRYNSNIPVVVNVAEIYGKRPLPASFLCYVEKNADNEIIDRDFMTEKDFSFDYSFWSDEEEGVIINIKRKNKTICTIEFCTNGNVFEEGLEEDSNRKREFDNEREIFICKGEMLYAKGQFKVLRFQKNETGLIEELAINFKAEHDTKRKYFEGAIRYHSDLPVNLYNPSK